jgi:D-glutamate cyclase
VLRLTDPIDHLLILDPGGRGVAHFFRPGAALSAARALGGARRVLITTGFALGPGLSETDGPPGAAVLGRALRRLGAEVCYVTDPAAAPALRAVLKRLGEPLAIELFPNGDGAASARRMLDRLAPTHLVAVERPGRSSDGTYRTARGRPVGTWNRPLDALFVVPSRATTIGVGDGGNEIGMGAIPRRTLRAAGIPPAIASVVPVDHLVVAGVSNWGAYGIVAHLGRLARRKLLHDGTDERGLIEACVQAGAVDGITRRREATVDGVPLAAHAGIVELMNALQGP